MSFTRRPNSSVSSILSLLRSKYRSEPTFTNLHDTHTRYHHYTPYQNFRIPCRSFFTNRRSQNLERFQRRSSRQSTTWHRNPRVILAVIAFSGATAVSVYYGNLETVPYTKRQHFVLLSPSLERQLGQSQFQQLKSQLKPKILPPIHPDSVRVRLIAEEIIEAVERGVGRNDGVHKWKEIEGLDDNYDFGDVSTIQRGEEVLDDRWVRESRKEKGKDKTETQHLKDLNWEVLVVKDGMVNACCLPGGKIIVFTGLLDHFRSDAEIATVIGHEVGHAIARHVAESLTRNFWFAVLQIVILQFFYMPDLVHTMSNLLLRLPFSRRMEMEADYIGLLLLASAGYDPRIAPKVYEKLGKITGDSAIQNYLSTHPSSKKRAQLLSDAKVMGEALAIYRETLAGQGVAGFL